MSAFSLLRSTVLQERPGRFLHRLPVPDGDQHAVRLPGQDSHSGACASPPGDRAGAAPASIRHPRALIPDQVSAAWGGGDGAGRSPGDGRSLSV